MSPVLLSQKHFDKVILTYTEANMSTVCYSLTYIGEAPEEGGRFDVFKWSGAFGRGPQVKSVTV